MSCPSMGLEFPDPDRNHQASPVPNLFWESVSNKRCRARPFFFFECSAFAMRCWTLPIPAN